MTEQSIIKLIGKPVEIDLKKPKAIGSTGFYLKSFKGINYQTESLRIDSKCSFEKRTNGLLLHMNYSNKLDSIPLSKEQIVSITIKRGKEK